MSYNKSTFCVLPFIGGGLIQGGNNIAACCNSNYNTPVAEYDPENPKQHWNSPTLKQLRIDLKNGVKNSICNYCWDQEDKKIRSTRNLFLKQTENNQFNITIDEIAELADDSGTIEDFKPMYIDFRPTNLCNYTCTYCAIHSSNSWVGLEKIIRGIDEEKKFDLKTGLRETIVDWTVQDLSKLKMIDFAGGEPLISDYTFQILEHLINIGNTDVTLNFVTNGSKLTFKDSLIRKYIDPFTKVSFSVSMESTNERHEYIRSGKKDWNVVNNNINLLESWKNEVNSNITSLTLYGTMTWPIIYSWYDTVLKYQDKGWTMYTNLAYKQSIFSIEHLPDEELHKIIDFYESKLEVNASFQNIINLAKRALETDVETRSKELASDLEKIKIFDKHRGFRFDSIFTEWKHLLVNDPYFV